MALYKNRILLIVLAFILCSQAGAASVIKSGPFIGIGPAMNWTHVKIHRHVVYNNIINPPVTHPIEIANTHATFSLVANLGYQYLWGRTYTGIMIGYDTLNNDQSFTRTLKWSVISNTFKVRARLKNTARLMVMLGRLITPSTAVYLQSGIALSRADFEFYKTKPIVVHEDPYSATLFGGVFGAGIMQQITQNLFLRLNYNATFFAGRHFSHTWVIHSGSVNGTSTSIKDLHFNTQQVVLSLNFLFT